MKFTAGIASILVALSASVTFADGRMKYQEIPKVQILDGSNAQSRVFQNGCTYTRATGYARQRGFKASWHLIGSSLENANSAKKGCSMQYLETWGSN